MKILEKLYIERIMYFKTGRTLALAVEMCDEYFTCALNKAELLQLSEEIKELANSLEGEL